MSVDFFYKFSAGVPHEFDWKLSMLAEEDEESVSVAADFRHTLGPGTLPGHVRWTLKEMGRQGARVPLPPYLQERKEEFPLTSRGAWGGNAQLPCFLLPPFPDQAIGEGSEWPVYDSSSGLELAHTFTVLSLNDGIIRLVGDAVLETDEFEVELAGEYFLDVAQGRLINAKVVIDTYRPGVTRNLALKIESAFNC